MTVRRYTKKDYFKQVQKRLYKRPRLIKFLRIKRIQAASVAEGEFVEGIGH